MLGIADYGVFCAAICSWRCPGRAFIALITVVYGLLCAFAQAASGHVRAHRKLAWELERLPGVCLVGSGIRLGTQS